MTRRAAAMIAATAAAVAAGAPAAHAWWTDAAAVSTGTLQATTAPQPSNPYTCSTPPLLPVSMTVTVPHADDRYDYVVRAWSNNGVTQYFERAMTRSGSVWTYTLNATDAGLLAIGTFRLRVHTRLVTAPTWVSTQYREWQFMAATGLLYDCGTQTV